MSAATQTVIETDKKRMTAMVNKDLAALSSLLGDDLHYTHSSAAIDTKQSIIDKIKAGGLDYKKMEPSKVKAREYGDTVILTGEASVEVVSAGRPLKFGLAWTDVYVNRGGNWQMVSWQSTRLPE
jgi:hypothetical protein